MRTTRWSAIAAGLIALLVVTRSAADSHKMPDCPAPPEITRFKVPLPSTARAIRSGQPLVIVSIGSSSTKGIGASDSAHTYPALLAEDLHRNFPQLALTVLNQGVGGEKAFQMLARFERDVLAYHPQLVIWQTGSNQTLTSDDVDGYTATIREGVNRLKSAHADVVLMDPQFSPRIIARPTHLLIVDSIDAVAKDMNVAVFRRFALMRHWVSSGRYKIEEIVSADGLHMNDLSYGCVANLLANSLTAATESPTQKSVEAHQVDIRLDRNSQLTRQKFVR